MSDWNMHQDWMPSKDRMSTRCEDLVQDFHINYDKIIKKGLRYWMMPSKAQSELLNQRQQNWTVIEITYVRSGVVFYHFMSDRNLTERWMAADSQECRMLHPVVIILDDLGFGFIRHKQWDTLQGRIKII